MKMHFQGNRPNLSSNKTFLLLEILFFFFFRFIYLRKSVHGHVRECRAGASEGDSQTDSLVGAEPDLVLDLTTLSL